MVARHGANDITSLIEQVIAPRRKELIKQTKDAHLIQATVTWGNVDPSHESRYGMEAFETLMGLTVRRAELLSNDQK